MNKVLIVFLLVGYSIPAMMSSCGASINVAKGKPYTVSPAMNYSFTAPSNETSILTDGIYSVGRFWTQKTTAGWINAKSVEIHIDLGKDFNISQITFNTVRSKDDGSYYPSHIAVFVGQDREHLMYVGDLAESHENIPGSYQPMKFILGNLGVNGRYVFFHVIPKGVTMFCDEIEVIEGTSSQHNTGSLSVEKAREFTSQLVRLDIGKALLINMAEDAAALLDHQTGIIRLNEIKQQVAGLKDESNATAIETALIALRGSELAKKIPATILHLQIIKPWAPLNPVSPASVSTSISLSLVAPKNGYDSGAALITNLSKHPMTLKVELEMIPAGSDLFLYTVPFIKTAAMEQVADPLIPVKNSISLRPGESRMVFVMAYGKQPGNWKTALHIKSAGKDTTLPITIQVASLELPKKLSLNAVNWGYLNSTLIHMRQQAAVADLQAHHTNVVVVLPAFLPNADPIALLDFTRLESYLNLHKGAGKVLLSNNLRTKERLMLGSGYPFLGEQWKKAIKRWYEGARQAAERAGFKAEQVYWYPFDEMYDDEIDQFIALAKWARQEIPGVKLYATLGRINSEKALPYLDIAQIVNDDKILGKFQSNTAETWLYDARGPAKSLSPYSYYRLMAWKAFRDGYKGIGFWAYADAGWGDNPGTAWDDFDGARPDYAVIYEGPNNTIISSRRWEAWRMGIEDYELLTMYAKAKGENVAKELAKSVMDNPQDTTRADEVRRKILMELSQ